MNLSSTHSVTGVILAGGQGQRMGGQDKGLVHFQHRPMIEHVIRLLGPQVDEIIINANRNLDKYQAYRFTTVEDTLTGFCGPLAGMLSAMQACNSDYILTAPCDSPQLSPQFRQRMMEALLSGQADIAVAHDGDRLQPVFSLISCHLADSLAQFLEQGDRKIDLWFAQHNVVCVDFSDQTECFINFNRPEDLTQYDVKIRSALPLLGFSAYSGTGKTTLLCQLIPALNAKGIQVGVIKHAHHRFDIDTPGKDSYQIRESGSQQTLIASSRLMALMQTYDDDRTPALADLIERLDTSSLDLILVEGFKQTPFSKIELHRPSVGKPYLYDNDPHIIAVATDEPLNPVRDVDLLNINNIEQITDYIIHFIRDWN